MELVSIVKIVLYLETVFPKPTAQPAEKLTEMDNLLGTVIFIIYALTVLILGPRQIENIPNVFVRIIKFGFGITPILVAIRVPVK